MNAPPCAEKALHNLNTPEGVIGYFEHRAAKLAKRALRKAARGQAHPNQSIYAVRAREDLGKVKALFAQLQGEVRHG